MPYYYTPAQMTATTESGITTSTGSPGKMVCVGEATTYQSWLEGTLNADRRAGADPAARGRHGDHVLDRH